MDLGLFMRSMHRLSDQSHSKRENESYPLTPQELRLRDRRVARTCGGVDLGKLDMRDKQDREIHNQIVERLRQAGFDNRLGMYDLVAGSYYRWLMPGWNARFSGFMKQQRAN